MNYLLLLGFLFFQFVGFAQSGISSPNTLQLLFVGDIMCHGPQIKSAKLGAERYDFNSNYKYISPIINWADIAVGNLELTIKGNEPYTGYPRFRAPESIVSSIKNAGFDLLVTANNHSNDGGTMGLKNTIDAIANQNIYQTGTFKSIEEKEDFYPLLFHQDGFVISFLNYSYGTNGLKSKDGSIVNLIDEDLIKKDIDKAKLQDPDYIIVIMHWGWEYNLKPNNMQKRLAKKMFEWGVDLIVGSHPHVVQPISKISYVRDSIEKEGIIAWSLGNFISNQTKPNTDGGVIFTIELVKDFDGNLSIINPSFIPVWRYIDKTENGKNQYYILPVDVFEKQNSFLDMSKSDLLKMKKFSEKLRNNIGEIAIERKVNLINYSKLINLMEEGY